MTKVTWGWKPPQYEVMSDGTIRLFYHVQEQKRIVQKTELRPIVKEELPSEEVEPSEEMLDEVIVRDAVSVPELDVPVSDEQNESQTEQNESELPETEEVIIEEEITEWLCDVVEIKDDALLQLIKSGPNGLECQKRILEERIKAYDGSEYVNSFTFWGYPMWLDKATRVGLKLRFEAELALGKESTTLWLNGMDFTLPLSGEQSAMNVLTALEVYASASYDVTQMHLAQVDKMATAEEIMGYDWTSGYPEKLVF